jgi:hypothetical protein
MRFLTLVFFALISFFAGIVAMAAYQSAAGAVANWAGEDFAVALFVVIQVLAFAAPALFLLAALAVLVPDSGLYRPNRSRPRAWTARQVDEEGDADPQ